MARGRPPSLVPTTKLNLHLEEALLTRVTLLLWSDVEGRVPLGAYRAFFEQRLREYFSQSVPKGASTQEGK